MIANSILKQLTVSEYHMGVCHKGGSNSNGKTLIFDASHYYNYVKKLCPKENLFSSKCHISDIDIHTLLFKNPSQDGHSQSVNTHEIGVLTLSKVNFITICFSIISILCIWLKRNGYVSHFKPHHPGSINYWRLLKGKDIGNSFLPLVLIMP